MAGLHEVQTVGPAGNWQQQNFDVLAVLWSRFIIYCTIFAVYREGVIKMKKMQNALKRKIMYFERI